MRAQVVSEAATSASPRPVDPDQLVYGVAGRSDIETDPPYFVFAAVRPHHEVEIDLALMLLLVGAGYTDIAEGRDLGNYESRTMDGKQIWVGTPEMLPQDEHQRGRPYLHQTQTHVFIVVTDDDTWAAAALAALP
jgi:hypothetical protein